MLIIEETRKLGKFYLIFRQIGQPDVIIVQGPREHCEETMAMMQK